MKKTIIRAVGLALALAMPLAGSVALATASASGPNTVLSEVPKPTSYTRPSIDRTVSGSVNSGYGSSTSTSTPTVTYTGKTALVPTYALGSWWSSYYNRVNVLYGNQSMNSVIDKRSRDAYIGPWTRDIIVADIR